MCEVASWIPDELAVSLRDRAAPPVIAWLTNIRDSIEEYDPLITVRDQTPEPEDSDSSTSPDSAFDEILSQLGKEIYKLDEYQRNLAPSEKQVSLSILNIFDECLQGMNETKCDGRDKCDKLAVINESAVNGVQDSDCDFTMLNASLVCDSHSAPPMTVKNLIANFDKVAKCDNPPIPPPRARLKSSKSVEGYEIVEFKDNSKDKDTSSSLYDNVEFNNTTDDNRNSDSESTCWSYKEYSTDGETDKEKMYAPLWSLSSGYHNSDKILKSLLLQHHATISRLSFDSASEFAPTPYPVYALHEVGDCNRCDYKVAAVTNMTPDKTLDEDGYEPVRDAITTDDNIYEEIEYGYSYTDEGCSCGGSVEVESCSISASSEGRESPLYQNLKDHQAYAISSDVIFWKNLLLDPYYNDDEEDEWITPEECAVYSREQRPPLVIPRITQYRPPPRREQRNIPYHPPEESPSTEALKARQYERLHDWSPSGELERPFSKANSDSPPFGRLNKRFGGSTENLLNIRRPNQLMLPASSSGDSLDVEVRDKEPAYGRSRKSRSMVAPKHRMRSPVPAPRMMLPQMPEAAVLLEGAVKRTKFSENGKKSRKNWVDCYMILTPTALVFYKDHKTYLATKMPRPPGTPPSPTAPRAELVLPLKNAHVVQCIQNHTRRFTRSLVLTINVDQYLLQDETEDGAKRWLKAIQNVYYKLGPPRLDEYSTPSQYQSSNTDLESLGRTPPVSRHSNRSNQKAGGSSNEDLSDSTEVSIPKSYVKRRLRNFFAKRPTMDSLVKKGIYQEEPVFGRKLEEVCPTTSPRVPDFVVACVKEIESNEENMCTDGLYRASGNLSQVQKIRLEVDQNNLSVIENNTDIHVLTGSLKLFFRELKEPLIPCHLFDRVLAACSIKPREAKIKEFRDIVHALPQCNRDTLKFLLEHLLRVTHYSERNRMHTANLAIVFGPTLLWAPAEQAHNIAIDCIQQNHVVEILLNEFKDIFTEEKGKKKS